jgi:hypothetical protein
LKDDDPGAIPFDAASKHISSMFPVHSPGSRHEVEPEVRVSESSFIASLKSMFATE